MNWALLIVGAVCHPIPSFAGAFTFQGQVKREGIPINAVCSLECRLFDSEVGGAQVGPTLTFGGVGGIPDPIEVVNGFFQVELDFGTASFGGDARWLQIAVACPPGGAPQILSPRQPVTAAPYAINAARPWAKSGSTVFYNAGRVGVGTNSPLAPLHVVGGLHVSGTAQDISVPPNEALQFGHWDGTTFTERMRIRTNGRVGIGAPGDTALHVANPLPILTLQDSDSTGAEQTGYVSLRDSGGSERAWMGFGSSTNAHLHLMNRAAGGRTILGAGNVERLVVIPNGDVEVHGGEFLHRPEADGRRLIRLRTTAEGAGEMLIAGPNGRLNFRLHTGGGTVAGNANTGRMEIMNASGFPRVTFGINNEDQGFLSTAVKNFRVPHPHQPGKDIVYDCIEGPEAAAYVRGTARLVDGRATIALPKHFRAVAVEPGMTVQLAPLSADALGLAVIQKGVELIEVRELHGGSGNYDFDYQVTAVRRGFEDYQVIRPSLEEAVGGALAD